MGGGTGTGGGTVMLTGLAAARAANAGAANIVITDVMVTYIKPTVGTETIGFFVQETPTGPGLFVNVDPFGLTPNAAPGDKVSFTITSISVLGSGALGFRMAAGISNFSQVSTGNSLGTYVQNVSNVAGIADGGAVNYDSELIAFAGTVSSDFVAAGLGHSSATLDTMAVTGNPTVKLRLPDTVKESLDLVNGCSIDVGQGVMWRFDTTAQPSAYSALDFMSPTCPDPKLISALATSATTVTLTFDRKPPPTIDQTEFTLNNGGVVMSAAINATNSRQVDLVTTMPLMGGTMYTVTATGTWANMTGNTAMFLGYATPAVVLFNELNPSISGSKDLVELLVTSGGTLASMTLESSASSPPASYSTLATLPNATVATGDLVVIHLTPGATDGGVDSPSETTSKAEHPLATSSANYDNAWDVRGGASGLTASDRVLLIKRGAVIVDALPYSVPIATPPSAFPVDIRTLQDGGTWSAVGCTAGVCTDAEARASAVSAAGTSNARTGNSVMRKPAANSKSNADWYGVDAGQSWGAINP